MSKDDMHIFSEAFSVSAEQPTDVVALNNWIVEIVEPYIKFPILEMNSGIGLVSQAFAERNIRIRLSDKRKLNRDRLRAMFKDTDSVREVLNIDFCRTDFDTAYSEMLGSFGTLIALNVFEDDFFGQTAINNARHLLRSRGRFILIAPVYTSMYYGLNENINDWKRYNMPALQDLLTIDFEIIKTWFLNLNCLADNDSRHPMGLSVLTVVRKLS